MTAANALAHAGRAGLNPRPPGFTEPTEQWDHPALAASPSVSFGADIAEFQPLYDTSYPYSWIAIRGDSGGRLDYKFATNFARAHADPKIKLLVIYLVVQPGQLSPVYDRIVAVLGKTCPSKVAFRFDVESGAQFAGPGDHSAELRYWVSSFAAYAATAARLDGYANSGDWSALWPSHPPTLKRFLADYTDQLPAGWYGYQYYGGLNFPTPAGYPRSCPPFGGWVDMNVIQRPIAQIVTDYGLSAPAPPPPVPLRKDKHMVIVHDGGSPNGALHLQTESGVYWLPTATDVAAYQALGVPGPQTVSREFLQKLPGFEAK